MLGHRICYLPPYGGAALIVDPKILKERGVIVPYDEEHGQRKMGYDLGIGSIFVPHDGAEWKERGLKAAEEGLKQYDLPPQGIAVIVSKEKLIVPKDMLGHAMPKSTLCEKGLLLLNTGLVDPGWDGELVGTVLNFSKEPISLVEGQRFLRLVFMKLSFDPPETAAGDRVPAKNRGSIASKYPFYFLNFNVNARKIAKEAVDEALPRWAFIVGWLTFVITLATLVCTAVFVLFNGYQVDERVKQLEIKSAVQEAASAAHGNQPHATGSGGGHP